MENEEKPIGIPVGLVARNRVKWRAAQTIAASVAGSGLAADVAGTSDSVRAFNEAANLTGFRTAAECVNLAIYGELVREAAIIKAILANPTPAQASMRAYFQDRQTTIGNLRSACARWNPSTWTILETHAAEALEESRAIRGGQQRHERRDGSVLAVNR